MMDESFIAGLNGIFYLLLFNGRTNVENQIIVWWLEWVILEENMRLIDYEIDSGVTNS